MGVANASGDCIFVLAARRFCQAVAVPRDHKSLAVTKGGGVFIQFKSDDARPHVLVATAIMSPVETPLLKRAGTYGRRIHHGRHMLDNQVPRYLAWFGIDTSDIDIVRLVRSIA